VKFFKAFWQITYNALVTSFLLHQKLTLPHLLSCKQTKLYSLSSIHCNFATHNLTLFSDTTHQCYCSSDTSLLSQRLPFYFCFAFFLLNFIAQFLGCFHLSLPSFSGQCKDVPANGCVVL